MSLSQHLSFLRSHTHSAYLQPFLRRLCDNARSMLHSPNASLQTESPSEADVSSTRREAQAYSRPQPQHLASDQSRASANAKRAMVSSNLFHEIMMASFDKCSARSPELCIQLASPKQGRAQASIRQHEIHVAGHDTSHPRTQDIRQGSSVSGELDLLTCSQSPDLSPSSLFDMVPMNVESIMSLPVSLTPIVENTSQGSLGAPGESSMSDADWLSFMQQSGLIGEDPVAGMDWGVGTFI